MDEPYWSKSVQNLRFSVIREMSLLAADLEGVINLGIGEPDFETPEIITKRAFEDALSGHTHYTASQGDSELLDKLALSISNATGIPVTPSSILITHGGMGALTATLKTILEPGDQVILPEPHFPDYMAHIALADGIAIKVPTTFEDKYIPLPEDIDRAVTGKTKVILLNSPNNPTGAVIPGNILDSIAEIAVRRNLIVISDEVYDQILYEQPFHSIYTRPGMTSRTVVIKSFSKSHAMTGWRVGYCIGPPTFIKQILKVVNYSTACASSISQRAAIAALDLDPLIIERMKDRFSRRIDLVCSRLTAMKGIRVNKPKGSFYILADIREITGQSQAFARALLKDAKVIVIPGYAFGNAGEGAIRIACTQSSMILSEAMDRIELFLDHYHPANQ
jgi:aspartate/methionine/tyrosine aminotransferase